MSRAVTLWVKSNEYSLKLKKCIEKDVSSRGKRDRIGHFVVGQCDQSAEKERGGPVRIRKNTLGNKSYSNKKTIN